MHCAVKNKTKRTNKTLVITSSFYRCLPLTHIADSRFFPTAFSSATIPAFPGSGCCCLVCDYPTLLVLIPVAVGPHGCSPAYRCLPLFFLASSAVVATSLTPHLLYTLSHAAAAFRTHAHAHRRTPHALRAHALPHALSPRQASRRWWWSLRARGALHFSSFSHACFLTCSLSAPSTQ